MIDDTHNTQSTEFWFLVKALKEFVSNEGSGLLPLPGVVPDMKADTESFVTLQTLYRQKSRSDISAVKTHLHRLLLQSGKQTDWISDDAVSRFVKYSAFLSLTRFRSLTQEYKTDPQSSLMSRQLSNLEDNLVIYILIRASDRFKALHHRTPGSHSDDVDGDIGALKKIVGVVLPEMGVSGHCIVPDDWVHEM